MVSATVTYLGGNGDGSFRLPKTYAAAPDLFDIVAADLNGDAKPDLVTGGFGAPYLPKTLTVLLGNGDGSFQPHTDYRVTSVPAHLAVADLNHDGFPDIAAADFGGDVVDILLNHGDGTFEPGLTAQGSDATFNNLYGVAVGDLDGDGIPDLVAANLLGGATGDISIMLGNGDGTFQPATHLADGGMGTYSLAVADLNGDGKQDLVVVNIKDDSLSILLGNGDGTFQQAVNYPVGTSPAGVVTTCNTLSGGTLDLAVEQLRERSRR